MGKKLVLEFADLEMPDELDNVYSILVRVLPTLDLRSFCIV